MEYHILHIEDSKTDADLIKRSLTKAGLNFSYRLATGKKELIEALKTFEPNIILCDHSLPSFNSKMAYELCKEKNPDLPFILVTGTVSEEFAVEMLKVGVDDYLLKTNLHRLPITIEKAYSKRQNEKEVLLFRTELSKSETQLRTIFENSPVGLLLLDQEGIILELNNLTRYYSMICFGCVLEKNESLLKSLPEQRRHRLQTKIEQSLKGEKIQFEAVYLQQDGAEITFNLKLNPVINREGIISGICITLEDITERKNTEQQKSSLLSTLEKSLNEIYVFDAETLKFSYVNQGALINIGYSEQEIKELTPLDLKPEFTATTFNQLVNPLITNEKEKIIFFTNHKRKNGSLYPVEIHLQFVAEGYNKRFLAVILDITERIKAEIKLFENENYLRTILDSEPECVKVLNRKGELLSMNPAGLAIIEAENEQQVLGRHISDLVNKEYQFGFNRLSKEVFKGNSGIFEFEITGLKGGHRWLETHAVPIKDTTGKIVNLLGVTRDITERKKGENEKKQLTERLQLATKSANMGIWEWNLNNNKVDANQQMYKHYGVAFEKFNSVYDGWMSRIHNEDRQRVANELQLAIANTKDYDAEFRVVWDDSSIHYLKATAHVERDKDGKAIRLIGANWDITVQKEKERHLKLLESVITNTKDSILITEAEPFDEPGNKIVYVNEAFTRMTGYSSEEVIGKTPRILQGPNSDRAELKRLGEAIRKWQSFETTIRNYKKNGEEFWINFSLTPVANEKGWYTHWIAIERDVTIQIEHINSIEKQNKQLREIAWSQSHLVRAPLARMLGIVNLIRSTKVDSSEYSEWLNHFTDSATELDNIIKDITNKTLTIPVSL